MLRPPGPEQLPLQRQPAATGDDAGRLDVEFGRLLCDYGPSASYRDGAGKAQASRGVDGWPAIGLDATSRTRQGDRAKGSSWWRTAAYAGGRVSGSHNETKRQANDVWPTHKTIITVWSAFNCLAPIGSLIATVFGHSRTTTMR